LDCVGRQDILRFPTKENGVLVKNVSARIRSGGWQLSARSVVLCVVVGIGQAITPGDGAAKDPGQEDRRTSTEHYQKPYRFTADWFTPAIPVWEEALEPYKGRSDLRYLEVGSFQGRSFLWVLENVANHPSSSLTSIDIVIGEIFRENIELSGQADRVTTLEGRSEAMLRTLPPDSFDIIYIDGSHRGDDVMIDAVLSWSLLRVGGVIIFDDYKWKGDWPIELRPGFAINSFVSLFRSRLEVVHRDGQLIVKRVETPCIFPHDEFGPDRFCSPIGAYVYDWEWNKILDPRTKKEVEITEAEAEVVRKLLRTIPLGETEVSARRVSLRNEHVRSLEEKLQLNLASPEGK
jgi:predicted O-methyltransferase YrrM